MSRGKNGILRAKVPLQHQDPKCERDILFCQCYVKHRDVTRAYREAGFKNARNANARAHEKVQKFRPYIERIGAPVEQAVVKKLTYDRVTILDAMARIGFANAKDYVIQGVGADGKPCETFKSVFDMTREEAAAIGDYRIENGRASYTLPSAKTRLAALTALGLQTNALKAPDKEVHNHLHLEGISQDKLEALEQQFIAVMGPQISRQLLGLTEEEAIE